MSRAVSIVFLIIMVSSCMDSSRKRIPQKEPRDFDPGTLSQDMSPVKRISGQLVYLPIYSNIPSQFDTATFDMSAFIAIHNTDVNTDIRLTKVLYFNQDGKLVDDFLKDEKYSLNPLATKDFYIPYEDQSGTGANFLVEWVADSLVSEPLIEAVILSLKPNNTVAVLSPGKIIREKR